MIARAAAKKIEHLARQFKAVVIMGPWQSGKTTIARACFPDKPYVSLENPEQRQFATTDPRAFLAGYPDGAILDEVQRTPDILSWLQQILDEDSRTGRFILTGSNNFLLLEQISQTLAGRAAYLDLLPLSIEELRHVPKALDDLNTLLFTGAYPPVQAQGIAPEDWFPAYVRTYVERDVRQIKNIENLLAFEKLLSLCAGRIGRQINYSNLGLEAGVDFKTVQSWLGILQAGYIIHLLPPYFKNFNKRVVKSPKLYFYDTGLACHLLRIRSADMLSTHADRGALFENLMINELLKSRFNQGRRSNLYYWRDQSGHEVDVIIDDGAKLVPVEIKSGQTITSDYFKGLKFWHRLTGTEGGFLLYGGNASHTRSSGLAVREWRRVVELD